MMNDICVRSYGLEGFRYRMYQTGNLYSMGKRGSEFERGLLIQDTAISPIYNNIKNHSRKQYGISTLQNGADILHVMDGYTTEGNFGRINAAKYYDTIYNPSYEPNPYDKKITLAKMVKYYKGGRMNGKKI